MQVKHVELKTYTDLLTLRSTQSKTLDHVLVSGLAGTGKTTLISRLAYQWATIQESDSPFHIESSYESHDYLGSFQLVFALDIRQFKPNQDIIDAIREQLLRRVSKESLEDYLSCNSNFLFLFDGFDELGSNNQILSDDILCGSHTIVTTRSNKTDEFNSKYEGYVQVSLQGFSWWSIELFVKAFVRVSENNSEEANLLLKEIRKSEATESISHFPLLLAMMCIIWKQERSLPDTISALYEKVIQYLVKHWHTKELHSAAAQEILIKLGEIALKGLVDENSKLIFKEDDFDSPDTVEQGCVLGLVTKDCTVSGFDMLTNVSFIHKTFQEYCAALYLVSLAESDLDLCKTFLSKIDNEDEEYVLKFSCGMNECAAEVDFVFCNQPVM